MLDDAHSEDVSAITAIYNEAIMDGSLATADLHPVTEESRRKVLESRHAPFGTFVHRDGSGSVLAWCSLGPLAIRPGIRGIAEIAVYVKGSERARGIGRRVIEELTAAGGRRGFAYLYAVVYARNKTSVRLFEQAKYVQTVFLRDANYRPDTGWEDVVVMTRSMYENSAS